MVCMHTLTTARPPLFPTGNNLVCNVHGVRAEFLAIGAAAAERSRAQNGAQVDLGGGGETAWPGGAYFLGKAMFTKGYREPMPPRPHADDMLIVADCMLIAC